MRSPWQPYFSARALLVSLRLPQVHDSAIFGESQIGDKDFGEFRTAKRACKATEQQGAITLSK
jgi:hypothetical protein